MGGKASYCHQKTLRLKRDDGELTEVAVDQETQVETIAPTRAVDLRRSRPARNRAAQVRPPDHRPAESPNPTWSSIITFSSGCCCSWRSFSAWRRSFVVRMVAPRKRSLAKGDTYECGVKTYGETWVRFRIQYYIYALMFVVFDIETVFLFPWAVSYAGLGTFALIEMVVFLVILLVGLVYAWAKGVLRWV